MPENPKTVPLQLDDFYLAKLHVDWNEPDKAGEYAVNAVDLRLTYDLKTHREQPHAYQMMLHVEGGDICEAAPLCGMRFKGTIVGEYRIENAKDEAQEATLVRLNGVSLLYSTFRGVLGNVSGLFQRGRFVLPSIDPRAVVEEVEKNRRAEAARQESRADPVVESPK